MEQEESVYMMYVCSRRDILPSCVTITCTSHDSNYRLTTFSSHEHLHMAVTFTMTTPTGKTSIGKGLKERKNFICVVVFQDDGELR